MADITEEEAAVLDEYWTKNTPKVGPNGSGFVSRREARLMGFNDMTVYWLLTKSKATNKSPKEIIEDLVRQEILKINHE